MRNLTPLTCLSFAAALGVAALAAQATASADGVDIVIDITAERTVDCSLSAQPAMVQLGPDRFQIATLSRFCNAPHDIGFQHAASAASGSIVLDGQVSSLSGSTLVAGAAPADRRSAVVVTGVDRATAQSVAQSLSLSITPSRI